MGESTRDRVEVSVPDAASVRAFGRIVGSLFGVASVIGLLAGSLGGDDGGASTPLGLLGVAVSMVIVGLSLRRDGELAAKLSLDPSNGDLTVETRAGGRVTLPRPSFRGLEIRERTSTSISSVSSGMRTASRFYVVLSKADGGAIELAKFAGKETAERLIAPLLGALPPLPEAPARERVAPESWLEGARNVRVHPTAATADPTAEPPALEVSWSAAPLPGHMATRLLLTLGLALLFGALGLWAFPFFLLTGLFALLALVALFHDLGQLEQSIVVRVQGEELSILRRRGATTSQTTTLPLAAITAIDASHWLEVRGGSQLQIRLGDSKAEPPDDEELLAKVREAVKRHGDCIQLPTEQLLLDEQIALDLALSATVEERTKREAV